MNNKISNETAISHNISPALLLFKCDYSSLVIYLAFL